MKKFIKIGLCFAFTLLLSASLLLTGCKKEAKIELKEEFKVEYYIGEELDVTGGILNYTNEEGKTIPVAITSDMVTGFSSTQVGSRQLIITYEGATLLVDYTVEEAPNVQTVTMGALYYLNPSAVFNPNISGQIDYVKFVNLTSVFIGTSATQPGSLSDSSLQSFSYTT